MYLNVILGNSLVVQLLVLGAVTGWETKDPTSCTVWPKRKKSPNTEERVDWHLASAFHLLIVATGQYLFPAVREEAYRVIPCGFVAETISRWNYIFSVLQKGPNKSPLKKIFLFIFCCAWSSVLHGLSLVAESGGGGAYSLAALHGLLIAVASFVAEHRLQGPRAAVVMAPGAQAQ